MRQRKEELPVLIQVDADRALLKGEGETAELLNDEGRLRGFWDSSQANIKWPVRSK